ncbi:MAG: 50S ribosomal protein L35 [Deltaproteobacteria bacterium]|nr:50S ribosomal protein L35 [Deltaproteobacteria bacterium]
MPKMKSNSGAKKRFRFTSTGKVKYKKAFGNHILTKKTTKLKRKMRLGGILKKADAKQIKKLLPTGRP